MKRKHFDELGKLQAMCDELNYDPEGRIRIDNEPRPQSATDKIKSNRPVIVALKVTGSVLALYLGFKMLEYAHEKVSVGKTDVNLGTVRNVKKQ